MDWTQYVSGSKAIVEALSSLVFTALTVAVGVIFIYRGLKKVVDHGRGSNPHESVFAYVAINFATGVALLQFAFFINSLSESLFGSKPEDSSNVLEYLPKSATSTEVLSAGITIAAMWVSVIGVISIFRGIVLWNSLSNGNSQSSAGWKGLWHIVFGVLAANIAGTVKVFFGG